VLCAGVVLAIGGSESLGHPSGSIEGDDLLDDEADGGEALTVGHAVRAVDATRGGIDEEGRSPVRVADDVGGCEQPEETVEVTLGGESEVDEACCLARSSRGWFSGSTAKG